MSRAAPETEYRLNLRLPAAWRERIQELRAERKERTGLVLQEADFWRHVLEAGFQVIEETARKKREAAPPIAKRLAEMREASDREILDSEEPTARGPGLTAPRGRRA